MAAQQIVDAIRTTYNNTEVSDSFLLDSVVQYLAGTILLMALARRAVVGNRRGRISATTQVVIQAVAGAIRDVEPVQV